MKVRVLHIEDSAQDAWLLTRTLTQDGWEVESHVLANKADLLRQIERPWDVVLADFGLPGLSTAEALAMVRLRQPDLPFVVVSGQIGEENAVALMKAGANDYVSKNFPHRLSPILDRLLNDRRLKDEQKDLDRRHHELENRFRQFFHHNLSGMTMIAPDGSIREINAALLELLGLSASNLPNFWTLFASPDEAGLVRSRIRNGEPFGPEVVEMLRPDGSRAFVLSTYQVPGETPLIWANFIDHTEQHQLQEQMFQIRKLESLGQLAGGVAHEFNNILAICQGHLALLERELPVGSPGLARVEVLNKATRRGAAVVRQLLLLARRRPIDQELVRIEDLTAETIQMLTGLLPENLTLRSRIEPGLPPLLGDRDQLSQALLNLVINARDVMPSGGTIVLAARRQPEEGRPDWIRLEVSDEGPGVPAEVLDRIFDPFFTTKEEGKGTGLGLSMVAGVAQSHQGQVGVDPRLPHGSAFFLLLPPAQENAHQAPAPLPSKRTAPSFRETRVLLVENEVELSEFEAVVLQGQGYVVTRCRDGEAAWELLSSPGADFDLVLTDLGMPGQGGVALVEQIAGLGLAPTVLVQSGNLEPAAHQRLQDLGCTRFLSKPFGPDELLDAVRAALEARS